MNEAPERIWAAARITTGWNDCVAGKVICSASTEYIRKDLYDAAVKERDEYKEACHDWSEISQASYQRAKQAEAERDALQADADRLIDALKECESEIDGYIRQEYPGDHPVHERCRQRDYAANPARIALEPTT